MWENLLPVFRIVKYNSNTYKNAFTRIADDWELKLTIACENRLEALKVERYIKSMKSRRFIEKLINIRSFFEGFKKIIAAEYGIKKRDVGGSPSRSFGIRGRLTPLLHSSKPSHVEGFFMKRLHQFCFLPV